MKERKKKKKQNSPFDPNIQQVSRFPVFSERFREDLGWWYKTDKQKAYKIFDLVEAVMKDPFKGVGKPEPIKYLDTDTWSRRKENFTI
ncbi:MAG: Txe/YoeB family addiction module toxin [Hydrococcus sp. C42_A2020_068]|nr:Txe/YoeB family addiction module toxin [Hydrococcus sp. C42_A2020_068]